MGGYEVKRSKNASKIDKVNTEITTDIQRSNSMSMQEVMKDTLQKPDQPKAVKRVRSAVQLADQEYYERMLRNSTNEKLVRSIRRSEIIEDGWSNISWAKTGRNNKALQRKLPTAKKDSKGRDLEAADLKEAKRTFRNADLCTTRESAALKLYFQSWKGKGIGTDGPDAEGPDTKGENVADDPKLMEYVDYLVSFNFGAHSLTDDYLSEHIAEIYEFRRKLSQYQELKTSYPAFFSNLSDEKRSILETRAAMADDLKELIGSHLMLHGIKLETGAADKKDWVTLRRENENKTIRHSERDQRKAIYNELLENFHKNHILESEIQLARQHVKPDRTDVDDYLTELRFRITEHEKANNVCGSEMEAAVQEIGRSMRVKEELIEKQQGFLAELDAEHNAKKRRQLERYIKRTNRRIRLAMQHADRYREFISFALGDTARISPATAQFLEKENQSGMMELIRFRTTGDYIEESLVTKDRVFILEKIAALRAEKDPKEKANANQAADLLEEQLRTGMQYVKMPLDTFYDKFLEYKTTARERAAKMKGKIDAYKENTRLTRDKVVDYAKENHLVSCTDRTFGYIRNISGQFKDIEWICLACGYKATDQTPPEVREEIREKGLRPLLNELLSITVEDIKKLHNNAKFDPDNDESWRNLTLVNIGMDMKDFLERLQNNDMEISDDEYIKLKAFGKMAQGIYQEYSHHIAEMTDPLYVLFKDDRRMLGNEERLYKIACSQNKKDKAVAKEVASLNSRYSKEAMGFGCKTDEESTFSESVPSYLGKTYFAELYFSAGVNITDDEFEAKYKQCQDDSKIEMQTKRQYTIDTVTAFNKKYGKFLEDTDIPFMADYMEAVKSEQNMVTAKDRRVFNKLHESGNNVFKPDHLAYILRPVEKDKNGSIKQKCMNDYYRNRRDINDYLSGDKKKQEAMLARKGMEMASYRFTADSLDKKEFFDITNGGFIRNFVHIKKGIGYRALYQQHQEYFESDAFTAEEREAIRKNVADNSGIEDFYSVAIDFLKAYGINEDGSDFFEGKAVVNRLQSLNDAVKRNMLQYKNETDKYFNIRKSQLKERERKLDKAHTDNPELIRKAAELEARLKVKLEATTDEDQRAERRGMLNRVRECKEHIYDYEGYSKKQHISTNTIVFAVRNGLEAIYTEKDKHWAIDNKEMDAMFNKFQNYQDAGKDEQESDLVLNCRLQIRSAYRKFDEVFTDDQKKLWDEKMGDKSFISFDSFKRLMRPVLRDDSGAPLPGYEEADIWNRETLSKFISGDPQQMQSVLFEIGSRILDTDFEFEKYNADYILKNAEDFYSKALPFLAFKTVYDQYPDFFESDAFDEEQKDKLRILMSNGTYVKAMEKLAKYENGKGLDGGKDMKSPAENYYDDEHEAWVKDTIKTSNALMKEAEKELQGAISAESRIREDLMVRPELVRGLAIRAAGERAALRRYKERSADSGEWAAEGIAFSIAEREKRIKLFDEAQSFSGWISNESAQLLDRMTASASQSGIKLEEGEVEKAKRDSTALAELLIKICDVNKAGWFESHLADEPLLDEHFDSSPGSEYEEDGLFKEEPEILAVRSEKQIEKEKPIEQKQQEKQAEKKEEKQAEQKKEQKKEEKQAEQSQQPQQMEPVIEAGLAPGTEYAEQGYHNCWACAGAAIFNKFVYLQDGKIADPIDQYDIRNHVPADDEFKTLDEVNRYSNIKVDQQWLDANKAELLKYMGEGKKYFGSIFESADFFMKKRKDFVMSNMTFTFSGDTQKKEEDKYEKQKEVFKEKLKDILGTGNLAALMNTKKKHYVTVTKIRGDMVTYLDSDLRSGKMEQTLSVEELFSREDNGNTLSLTWFEPIKAPDEMKKAYPGLKYDKKEGFSYDKKEDLAIGALNLAQTKGICISKFDEKLGKGMEGITLSTYIPKQADH